ncbi:uncharacterized protein LOC122966129 [Thunnus albacares]|uniref:uncharacterized protein LOC122966129 n=1 Tax=Thunnus albacares TaxID=8236 RepID=UPI001CF6407D|nr:uncharacterized protein LOC122966129 [Thunnus albacares]
MSAERGKLQKALCQYKKETLIDIDTLTEFSESLPEWKDARKKELQTIRDIKDKADEIDLSIGHVKQSENKGKAIVKYMKSKVTLVTADSRRKELEKELAAVSKVTLRGLEKLNCFLDAVEGLAVTSLHVFEEENQVLHLPQDISSGTVQDVITAARLVCPLILAFKRDAKAFFLPKLQNVEVLANQLDKYIQTTQKICDKLEESSFSEFCLRMNMETVVDLDLSEDDIQRMLRHINQLNEIRMDQHFRMVFLLKEESCRRFIKKFDKRHTRMLKSLNVLEESAFQLDRMNKGSKISSVAGSSVGVIAGIFTIAGAALSPVTGGASLALSMTGLGLGVTRGVNKIITKVTEIGVNCTNQKKANEALKSFMKDVKSIQRCLGEVSSQTVTESKEGVVVEVGAVLQDVRGVGKKIHSAVKMLKTKKQIANAGNVVAQENIGLGNVSTVASDISDGGQEMVNGSLEVPSSIMLSSLFIGMDIFTICKDSVSLAKGRETEVSQFIRARAALLRSEMDSWKKIRDSLHQGLLTSEEK